MKPTSGKTYWRSLGELQDTPEFRQFLEREFPVAASEFPEGVSRRRWMQLMGASLALGGLTGCRWQAEKLAPFAVRPENRVPGVPEFFATSIDVGGMPRHLIVTCYDGRPIKIEGNTEHPYSRGATDTFAQASILGLYDPDRSSGLQQRNKRQQFSRSWDEFDAFASRHFQELSRQNGKGLAVLFELNSSCSQQAMLNDLGKLYPQAKFYHYSPLSRDNARMGAELVFGQILRPLIKLNQAERIACFDADIIGLDPASIPERAGLLLRARSSSENESTVRRREPVFRDRCRG